MALCPSIPTDPTAFAPGGIVLRGKLDGALVSSGSASAPTSATMSIWAWNGTTEADTGLNITVYDWLLPGTSNKRSSIPLGAFVIAVYDQKSRRWYVISWERFTPSYASIIRSGGTQTITGTASAVCDFNIVNSGSAGCVGSAINDKINVDSAGDYKITGWVNVNGGGTPAGIRTWRIYVYALGGIQADSIVEGTMDNAERHSLHTTWDVRFSATQVTNDPKVELWIDHVGSASQTLIVQRAFLGVEKIG